MPAVASHPREGVALALGAGAARGLAHIGVLRVLRQAQVPVGGVAGTSIGAIVGGLHATGTLEHFEAIARALDRQSVLWFLDPVMPASGLIAGTRLDKLLRSLVGGRAVEELPIRYCAVAADLERGQEVRLERGELAEVMRASWAIPGLIQPQRIEGRWLVDGGVVAPVPVGGACGLGCGAVVAVDLHARAFPVGRPRKGPLAPVEPVADARAALARLSADPSLPAEARQMVRETLAHRGRFGPRLARRVLEMWQRRGPAHDGHAPALTDVVNDTMALVQAELARLQLQESPPDLVIQPRLPGVGLLEFHRAAELIAEGERAAREALASPAGARLLGRLKAA